MGRLRRAAGVARSLAAYYGGPFRARRMAGFYSKFVARGSLAFDIGAHAGNRIRAFRRLGARVIAVEPQPDLSRMLRFMFRRDPEVVVLAVAVGAQPEGLRRSAAEPAAKAPASGWAAHGSTERSFQRVFRDARADAGVSTLDALIARHGPPAFVCLDLDGREADALHGLGRAVPALSFRYRPAARRAALACLDRLESLGRYGYNWSAGASCQLAATDWLDAARMREVLLRMPPGAVGGFVYARQLR
ncbi:MAG TPA: FkbM family methyltransferase [Pelomicrobium sp.]|nr:FkbM family methyltransferase [Pelomicrobium sp.]